MNKANSISPPPSAAALQQLAGVLHLGRRARDAADLPQLGFVAVNESRQLFTYRQAALARINRLGGRLPAEVLAVSGLPSFDPQAPYIQWLALVFRHLLDNKADVSPSAPRPLNAADLPEELAADWPNWLPPHVMWMPLPEPGKPISTGMLLAGEKEWGQHELALAGELAHNYGHALARFSPAQGWLSRSTKWSASRKQRWAIGLALLALACCPVRMSVLAPAEVVPAEPFLVRAPYDGVVDHFHVRPNQIVKAGEPLFDLDTTALRTRLDISRKAYELAQEEYRQAAQIALTDEKAKRELALRIGRMDEKAVELEYAKQLLDRIQVKAPRDGVAVFADINDWQGRALSIGEKVLVLADPAHVELAISLPVADATDLPPDASVTLYPNGSAFSSFDGSLSSISYQAEPTPEGILSYRLKAQFTPEAAPPKLGVLGMAKIRLGWTPLAYYVLRRPLSAARQWLGW